MRSGGAKGGHDEEEYEDEDYGGTRRDNSTSSNNQIAKDGKLNDPKASATRSKHSVTEQRRRSKINERFQILRDLIPHSDQKRDTASFLLEVIEYVQFLQKSVQKYEGPSYQGWGSGAVKLMPWRNSHWRVQSFGGHPQTLKNSSDPGLTISGKLDESSQTVPTNSQSPLQSDVGRNAAPKAVYPQPELVNKAMARSMPFDANMSTIGLGDDALSHPLHRPVSDAQLPECVTSDAPSQQEEFMIEGGTISISSVYSQGLLNTLSQALQTAGLDLSHANISVQIDIGKRANRGPSNGKFIGKDHDDPGAGHIMAHTSSGDDSDQAHKRLKT